MLLIQTVEVSGCLLPLMSGPSKGMSPGRPRGFFQHGLRVRLNIVTEAILSVAIACAAWSLARILAWVVTWEGAVMYWS
jgi:hypothetical protein